MIVKSAKCRVQLLKRTITTKSDIKKLNFFIVIILTNIFAKISQKIEQSPHKLIFAKINL